ncbi:MAG: type III-A CRISPR-associated protein Csm2 [Clostridia bacterium]|nr:type III-A CRISPR-associated protein Csm2 [Clostridia bacterium]
MPYNDRNYGRGYGQQGGGYNRSFSQPASKPIEPKPIPADYVDAAERVMNGLQEMGNGRIRITTTKMRGFLGLVNDIYNTESLRAEDELLGESVLKLMRLRVRIVYDAGREQDVRTFVEKAQLLEYIKGIGTSRKNMIQFAHYMEALVAYHRFLGGKEN